MVALLAWKWDAMSVAEMADEMVEQLGGRMVACSVVKLVS